MSAEPTVVEGQKQHTLARRGTIATELSADVARGGISDTSTTLLIFHETYEQFYRDTATDRNKAGLDKEWSFMVRVRCTGVRMTADQWLHFDAQADHFADGTLRLTSRQGVQFNDLLRSNVKLVITVIDAALLTSFGACGEMLRSINATPTPRRTAVHAALHNAAARLSSALLPQTRAHHDILLAEPGDGPALAEEEPLHGATYLPRKFSIALVHGVTQAEPLKPLARWSLACVALPTCGQSLAEGERVHAPMLAAVEGALAKHGVAAERLSQRLTGGHNECARPYAGDIGGVGRAPGLYTLFVGGDSAGTRLSFPIADKVPEAAVATALEPIFAIFAARRAITEGSGDFCNRLGTEELRGLINPALAA